MTRRYFALGLAAASIMAVGTVFAGSSVTPAKQNGVTPPPQTPGWQMVKHGPGMTAEEKKRTNMSHVSRPKHASRSPYGSALSPK